MGGNAYCFSLFLAENTAKTYNPSTLSSMEITFGGTEVFLGAGLAINGLLYWYKNTVTNKVHVCKKKIINVLLEYHPTAPACVETTIVLQPSEVTVKLGQYLYTTTLTDVDRIMLTKDAIVVWKAPADYILNPVSYHVNSFGSPSYLPKEFDFITPNKIVMFYLKVSEFEIRTYNISPTGVMTEPSPQEFISIGDAILPNVDYANMPHQALTVFGLDDDYFILGLNMDYPTASHKIRYLVLYIDTAKTPSIQIDPTNLDNPDNNLDVRVVFTHPDYHMHDAKVEELRYVTGVRKTNFFISYGVNAAGNGTYCFWMMNYVLGIKNFIWHEHASNLKV